MKKLQYILMSLAGIAVVAACTMDPLESPATSAQRTTGQTVSFTATVAQDDAGTKTTLLDGSPMIYWNPGDEIAIVQDQSRYSFRYNGDEPVLQAVFEGQVPGFSGGLEVDEYSLGRFWAVYPGNAFVRSVNGIVIETPSEQFAKAGTFDPDALVMVARSDDFSLSFHNVCGGVKFSLTQEGIQQVEFRANNGEALAGQALVWTDEEGLPIFSGDGLDKSASVVLTALHGETFEPGKWYYLTCLPAELSQGFTMTFRSETKTGVLTHTAPVTVKRSVWGVLENADAAVSYEDADNAIFADTIFYTTTDGNPITLRNGDYNDNGSGISEHVYENGLGRIRFVYPITRIPDFAFQGRATLKTVWLPNSVTSIGAQAFSSDRNLESVRIPASVQSVGAFAFVYSTALSSFGGDLTSADGRCLIIDGSLAAFAPAGVTEEYTLPEGIQAISDFAFAYSSVKSLVIPEGVESIGQQAFYYSSLQSVSLPGSLRTMEMYAFYGSSLTSVDVPEGVTEIGDRAFAYVGNLTTVSLPASLTTLGDGVFAGDGNLECFEGKYATSSGRMLVNEGKILAIAPAGMTTLTIPGREITEIGASTFTGLSGLTEIVLGDGVTTIGANAFADCTALEKVTIPSTVTDLRSDLFLGCTGLKEFGGPYACGNGNRCLVKDGVLVAFASADATAYYALNFPTGVSVIGENAFRGCQLESIVIPRNVVSIQANAFMDCPALAVVTLNDDLQEIGDDAFARCRSLTSIVIPDSVTHLGDDAFMSCTSLRGVSLSNGLTEIGYSVFTGCAMTSVSIPDAVQKIGDQAFAYCESLQNVIFSGASQLSSVGNAAFRGCNSLVGITLPTTVTRIFPSAFRDCTGLTGVTLNNGLQEIGDEAFRNCSSLTGVSIPGSVTRIGNAAFMETTNLASVTLNEGLKEIGQTAFTGNQLTEVDIPASVESLGMYCFGNETLTKVTLRPLTVPTLLLPPLPPFTNWANVKNLEVAVPAGLQDYYQSTYPWLQYTITEI